MIVWLWVISEVGGLCRSELCVGSRSCYDNYQYNNFTRGTPNKFLHWITFCSEGYSLIFNLTSIYRIAESSWNNSQKLWTEMMVLERVTGLDRSLFSSDIIRFVGDEQPLFQGNAQWLDEGGDRRGSYSWRRNWRHAASNQSLVEFCYTGCIEFSENTFAEIMNRADLPQLSKVVSACSAVLSRRLTSSHCLGFAQYAEQHHSNSLMTEAKEFTLKHLRQQVSCNEEFSPLNADYLGQRLASVYPFVDSEEDVFDALVTWFRHDLKTRHQRNISGQLKHIRLRYLYFRASWSNTRRWEMF